MSDPSDLTPQEPAMSDPSDLTPQEPGAIPGVDGDKLTALADGNVGDLVEALDSLDENELSQLEAIERQGKARTTALGAIARERQQREEAANGGPQSEAQAHEPIGDDQSYAHMRASEVDQSKLTGRVLTADGWIMPPPSANPEG